jgi:hypothetical protein
MPQERDEHFWETLITVFYLEGSNLPNVPWKVAKEGDEVVLSITHDGFDGRFELRFIPKKGVVERAQAVGKALAKHFLSSRTKSGALLLTIREAIGEQRSKEIEETWPEMFARWFMLFFAHCLHNNVVHACNETPRDAELVTNAKTAQVEARVAIETHENLRGIKISGLKEVMEAIVADTSREKRELLEHYLRATSPEPRLEQIGVHYERLYPIWVDVKDIFTRYGSTPNWRDMARARFDKGDPVDDDLLARITSNLSSLSEETLSLIEDKGGECTPSSIAIEHAARFCGAWKYQFHTRTLFRARRESNKGNAKD